MNKKNKMNTLKAIIAILIVVLIVYEGQKEIKSIDFAKTIMLIRSFHTSTIVLFCSA